MYEQNNTLSCLKFYLIFDCQVGYNSHDLIFTNNNLFK